MTTAADKHEANVLRSAGWAVLETGWPDALAFNLETHRVMAVEWKRQRDTWKADQQLMAKVFGDLLGVPYYLAKSAKGVIHLPGVLLDREAAHKPLELFGRAIAVEDEGFYHGLAS